jgi:hypothetical protein
MLMMFDKYLVKFNVVGLSKKKIGFTPWDGGTSDYWYEKKIEKREFVFFGFRATLGRADPLMSNLSSLVSIIL